MITFKNISWKNFLSTGDQSTEIQLDSNQTTLIVGTNGAGKSTVLDALTFALFGKPFRKINKPQLVNTTNEKDCVVQVLFSVNNVEWKIKRGIKPNIFVIEKNGVVQDQEASVVDQQKWLEQNVLKMNYKSFTQIVILGSSTFVPFMQLSSNNRREVIEDLLDIKIFSSMNDVIKTKLRKCKEDIHVLDLKKGSLKEKVNMQTHFIEEVESQSHETINSKNSEITKLSNIASDLCIDNVKKSEELDDLQTVMTSYEGSAEKLKQLGTLKGKISNKVSTITKEHKFFTENTVCPTCTQEIEEEFRLNRISDVQSKAKELQSGYNELVSAIKEEEGRERQFTDLSRGVIDLTHGISQNNTRISGYQRQIQNLESEIQRITDQLANRNSEHEKLNSFKENLCKTFDQLSEHKDGQLKYEFVYSLLKDGGVKTSIIKKYLPLINQSVNKYLQMMDFYINFTLDEEFNETVQTPIHEDFSYDSFSEGEKMRIDLALLFTWREVARFKNSVNTNLLIMDEVFDSSLDGFGTEEFLKIIRYVIKDANIFVISHKESLLDKFEQTIKFDKVKGFSSMVL